LPFLPGLMQPVNIQATIIPGPIPLFAKIDLLTFGWGNCANDITFHVASDGKAEEAFEKLFSNVKHECEEP
jgi:hypothetical protein